jgi:hypothetical protein
MNGKTGFNKLRNKFISHDKWETVGTLQYGLDDTRTYELMMFLLVEEYAADVSAWLNDNKLFLNNPNIEFIVFGFESQKSRLSRTTYG